MSSALGLFMPSRRRFRKIWAEQQKFNLAIVANVLCKDFMTLLGFFFNVTVKLSTLWYRRENAVRIIGKISNQVTFSARQNGLLPDFFHFISFSFFTISLGTNKIRRMLCNKKIKLKENKNCDNVWTSIYFLFDIGFDWWKKGNLRPKSFAERRCLFKLRYFVLLSKNCFWIILSSQRVESDTRILMKSVNLQIGFRLRWIRADGFKS